MRGIGFGGASHPASFLQPGKFTSAYSEASKLTHPALVRIPHALSTEGRYSLFPSDWIPFTAPDFPLPLSGCGISKIAESDDIHVALRIQLASMGPRSRKQYRPIHDYFATAHRLPALHTRNPTPTSKASIQPPADVTRVVAWLIVLSKMDCESAVSPMPQRYISIDLPS